MLDTPAAIARQLHEMAIFQAIPEPILLQLTEKADWIQADADTVIFHKNDPGDSLYVLLEGAAKVHDGDFTLAHMEAGSCFGELALLDEGQRSMSVTTTTPARLLRIDRDEFFEVLGDYPDVMQKMIALLTRRLRFQTDQTLDQLRRREAELVRLVDERTAELLRRKEEAERQRLRAEQSERAEQQFLANMSHEIRTPMNAVMGMTRLLLQKNPREDQLFYLHSIRRSSEALLVILNDILDISKIQAGKLELEFTELSVPEILEQVRTTLQFRAEEKGLRLLVDCDPALPPSLVGDPVRLQQVLLNLAGNAVKFTEKGQVVLLARCLRQADGRCALHFEVQDTGIGMTAEQLAKVFEPFRQASTDITRKYGGTGLGLAISRQLVERFGGTLEARSAPGEGSAFWFTIELELGQARPPAPQVTTEDAGETLRGLRVLVVEDNEFNRIVAVETLEMLIPDVVVHTAENGLEALEKVQLEALDVILMDVSMPVMDGMEATRRIRLLPPPLNALPVVAFTASVTNKEVNRCLEGGMTACLPKPFRDEQMIEVLLQTTRHIRREMPQNAAPSEADMPDYRAHLEKLAGGKPERFLKYRDLYLDSVRTGLLRIEQALPGSDPEELRRVVHTMKPQFKLLGMTRTAERAQSIEDRLREGAAPTDLLADLEQLSLDIKNSIQALEHSRLE